MELVKEFNRKPYNPFVNNKIKMKSALEFLEKEVYLQGYMTIEKFEFFNHTGFFQFKPIEFLVSHLESIDYLTPRGLHLCLSQSTYVLGEELSKKNSEQNQIILRNALLEGRVKIIELNQRFRKEIKTKQILEGELNLTNSREGRIPLYTWNFNFGNKSIYGNMITVIAPKPTPQTNKDLTRIKYQ